MKKLLAWLCVLALGLAATLPILAVYHASPALAVEAVTTAVRPALTIPWGEWLIVLAQVINAAVAPVLAFYLGKALRACAPALGQMLTNALIDRMVRLAGDFALQAVEGAARGRTTSVAVAPAVIALGAQRAVDSTLPWIVDQAGGVEGIAGRLFRHLDLEPEASADNVLTPALDALNGAALPSASHE